MKLLFVNPHPDDAEFMAASTCQQAIDLGWDVTQILMTTDEYGTHQDDFKGKRIRYIRKDEMNQAAKYYGLNSDGSAKLNLYWMDYIDANLPFNREVYLKLRQKVLEIKPDIVIGPDSFFSMDLHPDHKRTGWLIYIVIKSIETSKRPELLLYHSFNTNFFIPIKDIETQINGWSKHRSQTSPLFNKLMNPLRKIFYNLRRRKSGPVIAEGFRRVNFTKNENKLFKLKHRILYHIFAHNDVGFSEQLCRPTPRELGLIP